MPTDPDESPPPIPPDRNDRGAQPPRPATRPDHDRREKSWREGGDDDRDWIPPDINDRAKPVDGEE